MEDLKEQLQNVQGHRRAALANIHALEEKIATTSRAYSQTYAEAIISGSPPDELFLDKWERETANLQFQFEQAQQLYDVFSTKETELQQAIDKANKDEQTAIYNSLCEDRAKLNQKAAKLIQQLGKIVEDLDEIGSKQFQASSVGKLDAPVKVGLPFCWYIKQSLIQRFRGTSAKFDEMLLTRDKDILETGDRLAKPIPKEVVTCD